MRAAIVLLALCASARADVCAIAAPRADVHVRVDGLRATIAIDGLGTRTVEAATCDELADAVALVIAMAGDAPPPPLLVPEPEHDPLAIAAPPVAPHVATNALSIGVSRATTGTSALVVGASRARDAHAFGLELAVATPDNVAVGPGQVHVWNAGVTASACLGGDLSACAIASAGVRIGTASDLMSPRTAASPVLGGGARLAWQHALVGHYAMRAHIDALANAVTTRFDVDRTTVWTNDRFTVGVGIDLVARFP